MWRYSALALLVLLAACERYPGGGDIRFRRDMVDQASFRAQEDPRPLPEGAVPVTGVERAMSREEAAGQLRNPEPATRASLERGSALYAIYCLHCHGPAGRGDGPVAAKIAGVVNLTGQTLIEAPDGFVYDAIRQGGPIMPALAESLAPDERWHIVNYVRRLQKP